MTDQHQYEVVVGLEVHAQLLTKSKLFCGDSIAYGAEPNTQVSPITLAHPGTLPKMNKKAIEFAIKLGLACHCSNSEGELFCQEKLFLSRSAQRLPDFTAYHANMQRGVCKNQDE